MFLTNTTREKMKMKYKIKETRVTEFIFLVDAENEEEALEKTFDIEPTETIELDPEVDIFFLEEVK
jgi:hypothetical protein|tara:strand:- start:379 stop:576 length:198 start_codon:yes stop_codon:yes gene_type:complete